MSPPPATTRPPLPDLGLIRYAVGSTLLPQQVAELITNLSLVARVSLRATAFFLEVILEATKMGTGMGLGLTRRALISAIGATRTMQALTGGDDGVSAAGLLPDAGSLKRDATLGANNAIFAMLDKYTAVGIYVVHHSLTMAELLTMSGITLVQDSLRTGLGAADASVRLLDGVFGSNETSRALSSFIDLVRREFSTGDAKTPGGLKVLSGLTRAITTFAIVQAATHRRTAKTQKMRVLYDCTVMGEAETSSWKAMLVGPQRFQPSDAPTDIEASNKALPPAPSSRTLPRSPSILESELERSRTFYSPCDGTSRDQPDGLPPSPSMEQTLDFFCGDDVEGGSPKAGASHSRIPRTVSISRLQSEDELKPEVKIKLQKCSDEDLQNGVVVSRQRERSSDGGRTRELRQVLRKAPTLPSSPANNHRSETIWEVITETTAVEETVEEIEESRVDGVLDNSSASTPRRAPSPTQAVGKRSGFAAKMPRMPLRSLFGGGAASSSRSNTPPTQTETDRDVQSKSRGFESERHSPSGRYEQVVEDEQEWQEISRTLSRAHMFDVDNVNRHGLAVSGIPSVGNGMPHEAPAAARVDAIDDPVDSSKRMTVVLKRVRKKLIKTTRVISTREVRRDGGDRPLPFGEGDQTPARITQIESASANCTPSGSDGMQRALQKAKSQLTSASSSPRDGKIPALKVPERDASLRNPHSASASGSEATPSSPKKPRRSRAMSHASMRSYSSWQHGHSTVKSTLNRHGPGSVEQVVYPRGDLSDNLQRFMRYASACYGPNFMNILGIGDPYPFKNTKQTHANVWAFAHHVGIPFEDVLLSSYSQDTDQPFHSREMTPIVNFVAVDRAKKVVVLACRGTLGLSDILVDLTCEYEHVKLACGEGSVHGGIFGSAASLANSHGRVKSTVIQALEDNPDYGLVTVGHSLGGGVATCLAMQWSCPRAAFEVNGGRNDASAPSMKLTGESSPYVTSAESGLPAGRPIHCYAYGPPAIADSDFAAAIAGLVTSVVHNHDVVPTLSIGTVRDFKQIADVLETAAGESCSEILGRTIGFYQSKTGDGVGDSDPLRLQQGKGVFPTEAPEQERCLTVDRVELLRGKTRNRAVDADYIDPNHRDYSGGTHLSSRARKRSSRSGPGTAPHGSKDESRAKAENLEDWLWSLIKTMRAHAQSDKLYPCGTVLCLESFEVYVRKDEGSGSGADDSANATQTRTQTSSAHRVILRQCEDVTARFAEPVFCRTLFRDHSPTGYEFCLDLLKRSQE